MKKSLLAATTPWLGLTCTLMTVPAFSAAPESDDPFLWLEDVTSEESLAWVEARNGVALEELTGDPRYEPIRQDLLEIYNSRDRIPGVSRYGDYYYNFWQDADHEKGIWRRCTPESYATESPDWETVLDLDALSAAEDVSWVWKSPTVLDTDHSRALLALSRGGKDAIEIREFDLTTKSFVEDGFTLPEARNWLRWIDRDTLLVGSGAEAATDSGYPYIIRRWHRGTPFAAAEHVFTGQTSDVGASPRVTSTASGRRQIVERARSFYESEYFLAEPGAPLTPIDVPIDAEIGFFQDQLLVELKSDWKVGDQTLPTGALVATPFTEFQAGGRDFDVLFHPEPRVSLDSFTTTQNTVVLNLLDNVNGRVRFLRRTAEGWQTDELDTAAIGNASARAVDSDHRDEVFLTTSSFLEPTTLRLADLATGQQTQLKQSPVWFDAAGLVMTQHEATAPDGTKIPYFQVAREDLVLDGTNPTLLYGYGGFQVPMTPGYSGAQGRAWLTQGGVFILANIRGGGEFGPAWHQAALKGNRQVSWNDFIAIGEDLHARGVTSREHLGIMGGSQGGLLMGVMYTQRPDLWGAVVCQVPLLDMLRFHQLLAGASWVGEYGNPDVPEEREFIARYSPYHNISPDADYPRILFVTSTHDDRVHPGHARKMAARLEALGHDFLYWENTEGGHGGAANNAERAQLWALSYTFLWRELSGETP